MSRTQTNTSPISLVATDTDDSREYDVTSESKKDALRGVEKDEASLLCGTHETQVAEGGEADLHKHLVGCKKNPGHAQFLPVNNFHINHLPHDYHDNDIVKLIKATADLTVRVDVRLTSTERPEFWPSTKLPYAFYNMRGSDVMRTGTGMVWRVYRSAERDNRSICKCPKCQYWDAPRKVWGEVRIITAAHVVFDDFEARQTTCRLFYDRQDSPLVILGGVKVVDVDIDEDVCVLECVTCESYLVNKLYALYWHWYDLWWKLNNKYKDSREMYKLIFIISHPHGCPKQVSVGHLISRKVVRHDYTIIKKTKYTYTTCTCPGSSGAHVHSLGCNGDFLYSARHVHSGVDSEGMNVCGIGRDYSCNR